MLLVLDKSDALLNLNGEISFTRFVNFSLADQLFIFCSKLFILLL